MIVRQVLYLSNGNEQRLEAIKPLERIDGFLVEVATVERALEELATSRYKLFITRPQAFDHSQEHFLQYLKTTSTRG
jgi:hypothetical protein